MDREQDMTDSSASNLGSELPSNTAGELLPCPFCGRAMLFRKALWPSEGNFDGVIHAAPGECGLVEFSTGTIDESVIAAWNTRHPASVAVQPFAYAYRYHDCIRFNHGHEVNGSRPIEAIPLYRSPANPSPKGQDTPNADET